MQFQAPAALATTNSETPSTSVNNDSADLLDTDDMGVELDLSSSHDAVPSPSDNARLAGSASALDTIRVPIHVMEERLHDLREELGLVDRRPTQSHAQTHSHQNLSSSPAPQTRTQSQSSSLPSVLNAASPTAISMEEFTPTNQNEGEIIDVQQLHESTIYDSADASTSSKREASESILDRLKKRFESPIKAETSATEHADEPIIVYRAPDEMSEHTEQPAAIAGPSSTSSLLKYDKIESSTSNSQSSSSQQIDHDPAAEQPQLRQVLRALPRLPSVLRIRGRRVSTSSSLVSIKEKPNEEEEKENV